MTAVLHKRFVAAGPPEAHGIGLRIDAHDTVLDTRVTLRVFDATSSDVLVARLARVRETQLAGWIIPLEVHAQGTQVTSVTARWPVADLDSLDSARRERAVVEVTRLVTAVHRRGIVHGSLAADVVRIDGAGGVVIVDAGTCDGGIDDDHAALARLGAPRCGCRSSRRWLIGIPLVGALVAAVLVTTRSSSSPSREARLESHATATAVVSSDGVGEATFTVIAPDGDVTWLAGTASGPVELQGRAVPGAETRAFISSVDASGQVRAMVPISGPDENRHHRVVALLPQKDEVWAVIVRRGDLRIGSVLVPGEPTATTLAVISRRGQLRWTRSMSADDGDVRAVSLTDTGAVLATSSRLIAVDMKGHERWRVQGRGVDIVGLGVAGGSVLVAGTTTGPIATLADHAVTSPHAFVARVEGATGHVLAVVSLASVRAISSFRVDDTGWWLGGLAANSAVEAWSATVDCADANCVTRRLATRSLSATSIVGVLDGTSPIVAGFGGLERDAAALGVTGAPRTDQQLVLAWWCPDGPRSLVGGGPSWDQLHVVEADRERVWLGGLTSGQLSFGGAVVPGGAAPRAFAIAVPRTALSCAASR